MRSTYDAVDGMNFIPMDKFQIAFWKLRKDEQEAYTRQYAPLKPRIGELTDPLYFDFIAFAQYATISNEIPKGLQVFKEFSEAKSTEEESVYEVVTRPAELKDNRSLPDALQLRAGDLMYKRLLEGFRDDQFGAPTPAPAGAPLSTVCGGVQALLNVFKDRGFCLRASVEDVEESTSGSASLGSFTVKVEAPANLWSVAALEFRRASVLNVYDIMVTDAYLRQSGLKGSCQLDRTDVGYTATWTV